MEKGCIFAAMKTCKYLEGGIEVSELGFGAWQLGVDSGWKAVSEGEAERMIRTRWTVASTSTTRLPTTATARARSAWEGVQDLGPGVDRDQLEVWTVGQRRSGFWPSTSVAQWNAA